MLLRDQLTDSAWWEERLERVSNDKRESVLHEYAIMIKWFLLHGLFSVVEETLRASQRASPDKIPVSGRYKSIAKVIDYTEDFMGLPMCWSSLGSEASKVMVRDVGFRLDTAAEETDIEFGSPVTFLWVIATKPESS